MECVHDFKYQTTVTEYDFYGTAGRQVDIVTCSKCGETLRKPTARATNENTTGKQWLMG
jgi:formylmethanofuran dehydrogenase subunit E